MPQKDQKNILALAGTELAQRTGHLCECGRVFDSERSRNIHRGCMRCSDSTTATTVKGMPTGKCRADQGQGETNSAGQSPGCNENAFILLLDSRRERFKFPPASETSKWKELETDLVSMLDTQLKGYKTLEHKMDAFRDVIYQHCSQVFGTTSNAKKEAKEPQKSRRQREMEVLRK
jgi:hypothetical protein